MWRAWLARILFVVVLAGLIQPAPSAHAAPVSGDAAHTAMPEAAIGTSNLYGHNLIVNGTAEYVTVNGQVQLGQGATVADNATAPPPDWTVTGTVNEVLYRTQEDAPGPSDPGPPDRGNNFFFRG